MPAIADQVATIEHDLAVAQTTCDSLRSENAQLKNALAALNADHNALQAKHIDALALVDETRQHAYGVATAALAMLKVSRRQIVAEPSEGTKALLNMPLAPAVQQETNDAVTAAMEPEKTDVRPELPEAEQGSAAVNCANCNNGVQSDGTDCVVCHGEGLLHGPSDVYAPIAEAIRADEQAMRNDMTTMLYADDAKPVRLMMDEQRDFEPGGMVEIRNTDRVQHNDWRTDIIPMTGPITHIAEATDPLPIFLKPRAVPDANVLG
jgi:hypothetical protein